MKPDNDVIRANVFERKAFQILKRFWILCALSIGAMHWIAVHPRQPPLPLHVGAVNWGHAPNDDSRLSFVVSEEEQGRRTDGWN